MRVPPTRGKRLQGATVARHRGCCWSTSKSTRIPSCRWARLTEAPGTSYCLVDYAARTGGASGLLPPHLASFGPFRFARRHTNRRNMSHCQDSRFTIRQPIPIASTPLLGGDGARAVAPVVDVRSGYGTNRETFEASNSRGAADTSPPSRMSDMISAPRTRSSSQPNLCFRKRPR